MSKIFEKNIQALFGKNPLLASKLFSIQRNKRFEVIQQGDDNINLNIIDIEKKYPIYETTPLKEIEKKRKEFKKYERYPSLYFYGIGNGIFIKLLFANPTHEHVIVFEPNLEILFIALNIVDLSEEIKKEKIQIFYTKDFYFANALEIASNPDILVFNKLYNLHIYSPYYEKFYAKDILRINELMTRAIKQAVLGLGNSAIDTLIGIEHHIKNMPEMIKNIPFKQLIRKNKKLTDAAVIVSTGPSLEKQLPKLKEIQNYVTIISVDASMPILEKWKIKPDFVTSIERVEETAKFFKKTSKNFQKDIIMIHASLQHEKVLKNSHGKKCLVMRPFAFNEFFQLNDYGYMGIGMSAANMAYELAFLLKHKTIVLIGQDLAYSEDGTSHAKGHVYGENEVKFKEDDTYVLAYGGEKMIRTTKVWNMFRNYFEKDIYTANQEGVITINATEGGARIEGAIEMPFSDVIENYVNNKKKKNKQIIYFNEGKINKNLLKAYNKTQEILNYGEKFQKRVEKLFLKVAKECEKLEDLKEKNQLEKIDFDKLYKLSNEIDKIKSKIETKRFFSMYGEAVRSDLMHREMELAKVQVTPSNTEIEKKAKLIDWIMKHKEWLFTLAGSINAQRIVIKRALPILEKEIKKRNLL